MEFFRILNGFAAIVAWLIVLAIIWAVAPYFAKFLELLQGLHDFVK